MKKSTCLIVGFGPGNGLAIAKAFGREGFNLALLSREPQRQASLVASMKAERLTARTYAADAGNTDTLAGAIAQAEQDLGEIEVLIYNALAPTFAKPTMLTAQQLVADFRVNVAGALTATLTVLPGMKSREHGTILFTGGGCAAVMNAASGACSPRSFEPDKSRHAD